MKKKSKGGVNVNINKLFTYFTKLDNLILRYTKFLENINDINSYNVDDLVLLSKNLTTEKPRKNYIIFKYEQKQNILLYSLAKQKNDKKEIINRKYNVFHSKYKVEIAQCLTTLIYGIYHYILSANLDQNKINNIKKIKSKIIELKQKHNKTKFKDLFNNHKNFLNKTLKKLDLNLAIAKLELEDNDNNVNKLYENPNSNFLKKTEDIKKILTHNLVSQISPSPQAARVSISRSPKSTTRSKILKNIEMEKSPSMSSVSSYRSQNSLSPSSQQLELEYELSRRSSSSQAARKSTSRSPRSRYSRLSSRKSASRSPSPPKSISPKSKKPKWKRALRKVGKMMKLIKSNKKEK